MTADIQVLCLTAASVGLVHTLLGPDHYLPFIAMARARGWTWRKTAWITACCGVGHVGSSVAIGLAGIGLGAAVGRVVPIETLRGELAAWLLLVFGLLYMLWGARRAVAGKPHAHRHLHEDGLAHSHGHGHLASEHAHAHGGPGANITPWVLFTIFIFGPCEPLVPLLMYPAATHSHWGLCLVTAVFAAATLSAMLGAVFIGWRGLSLVRIGRLDRYTHALAGGSIFACGVALVFLGL